MGLFELCAYRSARKVEELLAARFPRPGQAHRRGLTLLKRGLDAYERELTKQRFALGSNGRRCSARRCLELDHVHPWAEGGESTIENLRVRCRAHNQRYARQYFGKSRVEAGVQRARCR